jgi:hypothetical protein
MRFLFDAIIASIICPQRGAKSLIGDKPRSGFCDDKRSEDVQTQYALPCNAA